MATTIVTKSGSGAPTASDLVAGELAVDLTNGRLYTEDSGGTVLELGLNPSGNVDVTGSVTADGLVVDGTTSVTQSSNAATALTSFTNSNAGTSSRTSISFTSDTGSSVVGTVSSTWNIDALNANETFLYGSHGVSLFAPASQNIRFLAGGSEKVRITNAGNVGIGGNGVGNGLGVYLNRGAITNFYEASDGTKTMIAGTDAGNDFVKIGSLSAHPVGFVVGNGEKMRIDSSGSVLVGTSQNNPTSSGVNVAGQEFSATGGVRSTVASNAAATFNRKTDDGAIALFRKDGTTVGSIGTNGGNIYIGQGDTTIMFSASSDAILPKGTDGASRDNAIDLGQASVNRFNDAFITNGVTTGSDGNDKQDIETLSDAEQRVAVACKGLLRKWRWKSAVEEKGDDARIHFGIIAQDLQAAFEAEGLDAGRYAMFMSNTWSDEETGEERTRLGIRYHELLAFIIAAI